VSDLNVDDFLHDHVQDAIAALKRVGAAHEPRFDLEFDSEHFGKIKRVFGVFGNVFDQKGFVEDSRIVDRLLILVEDPDNERIQAKLSSGKMKYTPVNKRAARYIGRDLKGAGVHLPWTWRPMNFDFAALANKVHRQSPLPFIIFYSQQANFRADGVSVSRIFSLPVEGHAQGTWAEPIADEMLDPDVGLIIEANARG